MTVLDARLPEEGADVLLTDHGVSIALVDDLGEGRGPSWLDDWLASNAPEVVAWRRHIHAHPELSRKEYATTELIARVLRSAGLKPRIMPGGTGLVCDVGSGPR
ncbi:amidohydrolase, partial [Saccharothrix sp. MB29]|nr:amidohydrolase [Saccharothrix sp. MB29]